MKNILLFLFLTFSLLSYSQDNYVHSITKKQQFLNLSGKPLTDKFTNMKSVKVVYDYGAKKIYFFNSTRYTYHYDFCVQVLGYSQEIGEFNKESYNPTNKRTYLLANINYLEDSDDWVMELAASDEMNAGLINFFFNEVNKNVFFKDKLKFYLNSPHVIGLHSKKALKIPAVFSDFIFKRITEQSIENTSSIGILKKYDLQKKEDFNPKSDEIIIINTTPEFIPTVRGIIITELQTPLSHLVLLAKNRNIPVYVDTKVWEKQSVNNLLGKKVELITKENSYSLKASQKPIPVKKAVKEIILKRDLSVTDLVDLETVTPLNIVNSIGSKATNLGLLKQIQKELKSYKTPEYAFAIPFYYFDQHIKDNHFQDKINALYAIPKDSVKLLEKELKAFRKTVKNSKVNPELLKKIEEKLNAQNDFKNFRFRSSTNAEDMEGFNGAGLYDSKTAIIGDTEKTVEKAILEVWSSFWNFRAFQERDLFGIDHESCAMGVLVHRSFPDEKANGVLVTRNLYRNQYAGITVNVQLGEESVVKPESGVTCDEFYCHNFNGFGSFVVDYRSTSSLNSGKPILTETEIKKLFDISPVLERKLYLLWQKRKMAKRSYPLDIEFKYLGDEKQLYIKQARAYMD
ncbi:Phosphoenolpyruvate synthase [Chryseobacterium sp. MOF25P]|uniref:PEP/pyruvate-binding domain-containing protein n=1 Tax=unclassified Chryseobacterium TaxID=2593645 RepID=UPI000805AC7B|nr:MULTISPECIES: PEP/pyruvate-binding domain-containing protein [unclassified Chryseobacterium]OBW42195.1 Phosphoenolpyruvate synthase [Chryseobacterium sp. MOF25P]OBW45721.1 Phosphoenolpyruvate synthase [Chryseobacterium sp. BGARF1]